MGKLALERDGDAVNNLLTFYKEKVRVLEEAEQYFMAAIALAFAVETAVLSFLLVELVEDENDTNGIPHSVSMGDLINAATQLEVLSAPIDVPAHSETDGLPPKHIAKDAVEQINKFRRLIHPARAIYEGFDPNSFTKDALAGYKEMYRSISHSLLYYI